MWQHKWIPEIQKETNIRKFFHMGSSGPSKYQLAITQFFVIMRLTPRNKSSVRNDPPMVRVQKDLGILLINLFGTSWWLFVLTTIFMG